MQRVHIVGGGLAGLSVGLLLRRAGVPVTVFEAGNYPRHRVCGEFICGMDRADLDALGLEDVLASARRHHTSAWFVGSRPLFAPRLPQPALAVSRYRLDAALAEKFRAAGGQLDCGRRIEPAAAGEGWVLATGRTRGRARWLGLKAHYRRLPLAAGLEMHLAHGGYAGLTAIENDTVNVCALLPALENRGGRRETLLPERLAGIGLSALADRLSSAEVDGGSVTGVSHFALSYRRESEHVMVLGDRAAMIPPFTGNGMSMAFQSALVAAPRLIAWSRGETSWTTACREVSRAMRHRFCCRMRWAACLHPFLLGSAGQSLLRGLVATHALPFGWLFARLH